MGYQAVVCVKQVPDTENLTGNAMKEDGTVNRAALPAILNPEDLNALELALQIVEAHGGSVTAVTMGLPKAADVLRECLYRGADRAVLLTDRRAAGSDTLATSYVLSCAIRALGRVDLVLCGRQAIDGDTAQTGPQLAEKLSMPQVTYVDELREIGPDGVVVRRGLEHGYEVVRAPLPVLLTVTAAANDPRPPSAKRLMKHKKARAPWEMGEQPNESALEELRSKGLLIEQWDMDAIQCAEQDCGMKGSPTRVKEVDSVQLVSEEHRAVEPTTKALSDLVQELIDEHIFD
ncbi:MAG: electron transfer flavoprotein subunit beta [Planctomycetes bacterium SM23_32]|nr:MAG: electron transfer flavoprotein subunit beta [Planctomycetes bacterium SM23_32]